MFITLFTDLPDLVILDILHYLSSFDAIQAFYNMDDPHTDRISNLLIEARCFSTIHHLRLPLFNFVCDHVLPRMGSQLSHLTLYDHQLSLARHQQIFVHLTNLASLHLIHMSEVLDDDNVLAYFLCHQLKNLTIEFISEHHIEAQAYICEQFVFNTKSENLINCQLLNNYGIQLRHLSLIPNYSLEEMTVQLKQVSDLHILFDHLVNIKVLNVELCRWTVEDIKYDYTKLPIKLARLKEFSLQTPHALSFDQMLIMIRYLIHLTKLSFIYQNYDEHGIDITELHATLTHLYQLREIDFIIKFIYFNLNPKLTFEKNLSIKEQWNVHTYHNIRTKNYLAYTQPFSHRIYSLSTDILLEDEWRYFPSIINLNLTTHTKQYSLSPVIHLLNSSFPSLTHLHIVDSFGIESTDDHDNVKLPNIRSLNISEVKISNVFSILFRSMPNLIHLQIHSNVFINCCDLQLLFVDNKIQQLELITNEFDRINGILLYFPFIEQLIINHKKQINPPKRTSSHIVFNWFEISSRLYLIYVKADKLSDLFYLVPMESNESIHVQYWNEMLTLWK